MAYVEANGVRIYVEEWGSGPPLLLIMGLGASLDTWAAQREAFAAHFRVIAFDNRGAGRSDAPPPPWTVGAMAEDAAGVLDAVGIERAHVLGVSMGGMIAQELAIAHPERVASLVVAVSFARPDPVRRTFLLHRRWARLHGAEAAVESVATLPWLLSPALINDPRRLADALELFASMPFMSAEAYGHQVDAILEHRTLERLHRVRAPTLVLAAAEDVLTPVFLSEEIAAAIPGARLEVLPRGNHATLVEYPEDFNRAVIEWLRREAKENPDSLGGNAPPRR
jgi:pimeloyl-ACP methyl ester carboxylesterase